MWNHCSTGNVPTWNRSSVKMILRKWYHQMWYLTCLKQLPFYTWEDCFCFLIITMLITITTFCLLTTSPQIGHFLQTIFVFSFIICRCREWTWLGFLSFWAQAVFALIVCLANLGRSPFTPGSSLPATTYRCNTLEASTSQGSQSLLLVLSSL